jgi:hypothetical protein
VKHVPVAVARFVAPLVLLILVVAPTPLSFAFAPVEVFWC